MQNQSGDYDRQLEQIIKSLPLEEKVPVTALNSLLEERKMIEEQEQEQITQITIKYANSGKVYSDRAAEIIQGSPLTTQQLEYVEKVTGDKASTQKQGKGKKIPGYWLKVLKNSKIHDLITENDEKVLQHLENIDFELKEDFITLIFSFSSTNPYFEQTKLQRTVDLVDGEAVKTTGDLISWKQGKCLTYDQKTVVNKKTGEKKVTNGDMKPSVFHFFRNSDNQNEEQAKHLQVQEMIFNDLAYSVIPYSLQFYLGLYNQVGLQDDIDEEEEYSDEEDVPRKMQHK